MIVIIIIINIILLVGKFVVFDDRKKTQNHKQLSDSS